MGTIALPAIVFGDPTIEHGVVDTGVGGGVGGVALCVVGDTVVAVEETADVEADESVFARAVV
ncbi:MAG: hypothetical protein ACREJX_16085, partial [Polyangiaceae bacterium]